jgi:hypothetical protein
MATCEVEQDPVYVLTLTAAEARFLRDLMAHIGGCPHETRRLHANTIAAALNTAGLRVTGFASDFSGTVECLPTSGAS